MLKTILGRIWAILHGQEEISQSRLFALDVLKRAIEIQLGKRVLIMHAKITSKEYGGHIRTTGNFSTFLLKIRSLFEKDDTKRGLVGYELQISGMFRIDESDSSTQAFHLHLERRTFSDGYILTRGDLCLSGEYFRIRVGNGLVTPQIRIDPDNNEELQWKGLRCYYKRGLDAGSNMERSYIG